MTIAHLLEALLSKAGALSGNFGDATAFRQGDPRKEAEEALHRLGYHRHGEEVLYNPHTGKQMPGSVFMAPTFYQRLKHMVCICALRHAHSSWKCTEFSGFKTEHSSSDTSTPSTCVQPPPLQIGNGGGWRTPTGMEYADVFELQVNDKVHARGRGPVTVLTKQPVEGRARMGGLRFGEMERDGTIAHGATAFLTERLLHSSDATRVPVCNTCGLLAYDRAADGGREAHDVCNNCGAKAEVKTVTMPHAMKLLLQELTSMCIIPRLSV